VDQAVEDGVSVGGVTDQSMPVGYGDLAGDEGGLAAVAGLEDFEQVMPGPGVQRFKPPVIEDQQVDGAEACEASRQTAVAMGDGQLVEQFRDPDVEDGVVVAAGFVAQGAGDPALADAGQSNGIMPGVRYLRCGLPIRFTPAAVSWSLLSGDNSMTALNISLFASLTPPWPCCRPG
jgi:hypothetical protein